MAIIKVEFGDGKWEAVPRRLARDERLSLDTRGLALFLATRSEDFTISIRGLRTLLHPHAGKDRLGRMLRELEQAGYLWRVKERHPGGRFAWKIIFRPTGTMSGLAGCGEPGCGPAGYGEPGHILNTTTRKTLTTKNTHTKERRLHAADVCSDGKFEKTAETLHREGRAIAKRSDYAERIQQHVDHEGMSEDEAWSCIQDELIGLVTRETAETVQRAKKRRQGRDS